MIFKKSSDQKKLQKQTKNLQRKKSPGAGEMTQWLRTLIPLSDELSSIPSTHYQMPITPAPGDQIPSSDLQRQDLYTCGWFAFSLSLSQIIFIKNDQSRKGTCIVPSPFSHFLFILCSVTFKRKYINRKTILPFLKTMVPGALEVE